MIDRRLSSAEGRGCGRRPPVPCRRCSRVRERGAARGANGPAYGPLGPVEDEPRNDRLLLLPQGFRYVSFGWTGEPLEGGGEDAAVPRRHGGVRRRDETACMAGSQPRNLDRHGRLCARAPTSLPTIPAAGGGTTTVEFDTRRGRLVRSWASLSGTVRNCAGGPTPWGSWLTCEETVSGPASGSGLDADARVDLRGAR